MTAPPRDARASVQRASEIAQKFGFTNQAAHARSIMDAEFREGTVVVVGEIKRGKSSLVNALVGQRELLPVDVLMCTSAPIRVLTNSGIGPAPIVSLVRGEDKEVIPADDLKNWVTHQAAQDRDRELARGGEGRELPSAAEIQVDFDGLGSLTIIDTPGVGGLDEHAVSAALTEARHAGVLLMVCDASTPITAPEMDILRTARERVGSVIVAVTKTDKNVRRWRSIVEDNKRLIRTHLGIDIPVIGVSSLRAQDAAELSDPARREVIEQRCGIADLRRHILAELQGSAQLGVRTAVDSMIVTMGQIVKDIDQDLELHSGASDAVAKLEDERAKLEKFREETGNWEQVFQRDISLARNRISGDLDRDLEKLRDEWTNYINASGMKILRQKSQVFSSQIELQFRAIIENSINAILAEVEKSARELLHDEQATRTVMEQVVASLLPPELVVREVDKKTKDLVDPTILTMGVMGGGMLAPFTLGLAPLAAGLWIGVNLGFKAMRNGKQHLITWLRETQGNARGTAMRMIDHIITTARTEILMEHRRFLRAEQKRIQTKIEEARRIAQESETERKNRIARMTKNREIVQSTINELQTHKDALTGPRRMA